MQLNIIWLPLNIIRMSIIYNLISSSWIQLNTNCCQKLGSLKSYNETSLCHYMIKRNSLLNIFKLYKSIRKCNFVFENRKNFILSQIISCMRNITLIHLTFFKHNFCTIHHNFCVYSKCIIALNILLVVWHLSKSDT